MDESVMICCLPSISSHRKAGGLPNLRTLKGSKKCSRGLSEWAKPPEPNNLRPHILDFKTVLVQNKLSSLSDHEHRPFHFHTAWSPNREAWESVKTCFPPPLFLQIIFGFLLEDKT
jgi:hypothetical protein